MSDEHIVFEDQPAMYQPDSYDDKNEDGLVMMDNEGAEGDYQPHWGSSLETNENPEDDEAEEEEEIPFVDDLPLFANLASKAIHDETKQVEKKRDIAEKVGGFWLP